jgi:ribosomal protein S18 acetylase RimI-like enzyme
MKQMAALPEQPEFRRDWQLVELRRVSAEQLAPVLDEEIGLWKNELDWDFRASADLVRKFVQMQALGGFALTRGGRVVGYCYYVCEEGKGLVGDLCVLRAHRTELIENALLEASLNAMFGTLGIRRVEGQIMMISSPLERTVPIAKWFRCYPRFFMQAPLGPAVHLPEKPAPGLTLIPWSELRQEETARLIVAAYQGHVDSHINDQYRSPSGARRFLMNIVQYPGCGTFFGPASWAAVSGNELVGVSLSSLVAADVGHITQVCIAPAVRATGLGYELVRQSLMSLAVHGCRSVSLTVTSANLPAVRLYERMGFVNRRNFAAYIWEPR